MSQVLEKKSIWHWLGVIGEECRVDRLFQEDSGVLAPLWFGADPDSPWHVFANILRVIITGPLAPVYLCWVYLAAPWKQAVKAAPWTIEWAHVPDAMIMKPPSTDPQEVGYKTSVNGEYAVTNNKPRWLLEVHFQGRNISSERQVPYDGGHPDESALSPEGFALRKVIQDNGYTAISYSMKSATHMFNEAKRRLDASSEEGREFSLVNRQLITHIVLECYAEARTSIPGKTDGVEFIWLDEFCLSDAQLPNSTQSDQMKINRQRGLELSQLVNIFRSAKQVVVFCHKPRCDHMEIECDWGKRLFTLGEIMYTEEVYQMTRRPGPNGGWISSITILPGYEFRGAMQARAARDKQWHLYNIMQHSANSGSINWQSAIHSLVVEAIRRDEADGYHLHNMLGKALNGLLPRRSKLEDLYGVDGWADLAWLLELNQGFYNAAALAAVCQLADPWVGEYRWWGKPVKPQEGRERLEPLSIAIPAKFRNDGKKTLEPVLSIIGPRSVKLKDMLRRDGAALHRNPDISKLKNYATLAAFVLGFVGIILLAVNIKAAVAVIWITCTCFTTLELLVGTMYVEKDAWVLLEDRLFPDGDPIRFLRERDYSYKNTVEWGDHQLIPRWDVSSTRDGADDVGQVPRPFRITLVDLRTGVYTKAMVTSRPNDMVVLAVHGGGITCMLLEREEKALGATVSTKVGMANIPPFVLAQADYSGTVYVGGVALCDKPTKISANSNSKSDGSHLPASHPPRRSHEDRSLNTSHSPTLLGSPPSPRTSASLSRTPGVVLSSSSISQQAPLPEMTQSSSSGPIATTVHREADTPAVRSNHEEQVRGASPYDFDPYQMDEYRSGRVQG